MRFGCSYAGIAGCHCGATTIRERRDEWIKLGIFAELNKIAREFYDRIIGLLLESFRMRQARAKGGGAARMVKTSRK